ncbi:MAG: dihydrodipicolinate synthase family protein [Gemmataceae bacterium]
MKPLHGVLAIIHTPFTDTDEIDGPTLHRAINWAYSVGADGLGTGMVSETMKLTSEERHALTGMLVEFSEGRGPTFAAVGERKHENSRWICRGGGTGRVRCGVAVPPLTSRLAESPEHGSFPGDCRFVNDSP